MPGIGSIGGYKTPIIIPKRPPKPSSGLPVDNTGRQISLRNYEVKSGGSNTRTDQTHPA